MSELAALVRAGDIRSIARAISLVEDGDERAVPLMKSLHTHTGAAHVVGVTGVMGSGKSSLILQLAQHYRASGRTVGVLAIDPTSPFSGGALLGDRIRMTELAGDSGVFIRSMGTRGMLGGLAGAVYDAVDILDAAGFDIILIETVGVGQDEVDVVKVADTTVVVLVAGLGDSVQTIKAGLMEIADIFVVNKADKPGLEQAVAELQSMLDLQEERPWKVPILPTSASQKSGVEALATCIQDHLAFTKGSDVFTKRRTLRYEAELLELLRKRLMSYVLDDARLKATVDHCLQQISCRTLDPYSAAERILGELFQ